MEKLEELLATRRAVEPQPVALSSIKTDPAYQPRVERLAPHKQWDRLEAASAEHVADMAGRLEEAGELEPVLAARVGGRLFLVDGHHRLKAYRRAGRREIPTRIMDANREQAIIASKGVNCDGAKLPLHKEQKSEAAWQYLALRTRKGRRGLPEGESLRSVARTFGVSPDTISRMARRLPKVNHREYQAEACDPGTGWPRWRTVRGNSFRDAYGDLPEDQREAWKDEKRAKQLGRIIDRDGLDAFLRSLRLLELDEIDAAAEALAEASGEPEEALY